jgi:hypothetical protein
VEKRSCARHLRELRSGCPLTGAAKKKCGGHTGEPAEALFQGTIATTDRKMNMQHATDLLIAAAAVLPQGTA